MKQLTLIIVLFVSLFAAIPVRAAPNPAIWPIEREIAESPVEIGIGYTARGYWVWRMKGTADTFMPNWTYTEYHNMAMVADGGKITHVHPGQNGHCVTLSYDDVDMAATWKLSEIRAVSYEKGNVYVVSIHNPAKPPSQAVYNKEHAKQAKDKAAGGWCTADNRTWIALGYNLEVIHD